MAHVKIYRQVPENANSEDWNLCFQKVTYHYDDGYIVKTVFLTYHENAYNYFEHDIENAIMFLSAIEIVKNPMIVFE